MSDLSTTGIRERIQKLRFADARVRVSGMDGAPLALSEVTVEQTAHAFLFGQIGFDLVPSVLARSGWDEQQAELYKQRMRELFNAVTLPFYWGRFEPEEGRPATAELLETARWFQSNGFTVKGHPLCWHTLCPDWLSRHPNDAVLEKQRARIRREVSGFRGLIDTWDVVNESVIMPVFDRYDNAITRLAAERGAVTLADALFREARSAHPRATLLINDFDLGPAYERIIEALLERGAPLDAIGLQTHQHQGYRGAEAIWDHAERFSRFGLPLHFTENTLVSGRLMPPGIVDLNDYQVQDWPSTPEGEERQRREATEFYSVLYSHPAVQAVTWWGLPDGGWLNAPGGLLRRDMSPKPAYLALRELIQGEWWTPKQTLQTGADGSIRLRAALGSYRISARGSRAEFQVSRDTRGVDVRLG